VKQIREKFKEKCEEEANKIEISNNTNVNGGKTRPKNLVKWIMEEFEDKNLDKVKRTLLVTLDDISKGNSNLKKTLSHHFHLGLLIDKNI
jgi:hypothetical protein